MVTDVSLLSSRKTCKDYLNHDRAEWCEECCYANNNFSTRELGMYCQKAIFFESDVLAAVKELKRELEILKDVCIKHGQLGGYYLGGKDAVKECLNQVDSVFGFPEQTSGEVVPLSSAQGGTDGSEETPEQSTENVERAMENIEPLIKAIERKESVGSEEKKHKCMHTFLVKCSFKYKDGSWCNCTGGCAEQSAEDGSLKSIPISHNSVGSVEKVKRKDWKQEIVDGWDKIHGGCATPAPAITKEDIERIYAKYAILDSQNWDLSDTITMSGDVIRIMINHPISAMRAELLEILERDEEISERIDEGFAYLDGTIKAEERESCVHGKNHDGVHTCTCLCCTKVEK